MSASLYTDLLWLPRAPGDFRARLKAVPQGPQAGPVLRALAGHGLDGNQLAGLARRLAVAEAELATLTRFRLGLVGTGTLDLLAPQIAASALRHGLHLTCVTTPYGQAAQTLFDPASALCQARCDAVLLAFDHRDLLGGEGAGGRCAQDALDQIAGLCQAVRDRAGAVPVVQTLAAPPESLLGHYDLRLEDSLAHRVARFNAGLVALAEEQGALILDAAAMAARVGGALWHDPGAWLMAKLPMTSLCWPYYADRVAGLAAAMRGLSRRVLVLDLDNTLWGGVIGDDGLDGIRLGQGSAQGEAFLQMQRYALTLRDLGVVLAVSSKNDEAVARAVFRDHPDMLLREEHIAAFQANWLDKAANLRRMAEDLSLGLSSFVFVDDNPAERALIRRELPEVAVPELPEDPALHQRTVAAAGYFDTISLSGEDRARARFYEGNARRQQALTQSEGLGDYLASLAMEIEFSPFRPIDRARVTQLINKSNQFNLTTRRYTEVQVAALADEPGVETLQVRLRDAFGDNGLIAVVILRTVTPGHWEIDSWLMSCRVLGRRVEEAVLQELWRRGAARGITRLTGVYCPTQRNGLVADHYRKLGFEPAGEGPDGATFWSMTAAPSINDLPFMVLQG